MGETEPPPLWLIIITVAVFLGFLLAFGHSLPDVFPTHCSTTQNTDGTCTGSIFPDDCGILYIDCITAGVGAVFNMFVLLFDILTLGGINSPLPFLIQVPILFFFALTWGVIIVKFILSVAEIGATAVP